MKTCVAMIVLVLSFAMPSFGDDASVKAQASIDKALAYLKAQQQADGSWQKSPQEPPGISALVLHGFIADAKHGAGDPVVKKGIAALLKFQQPDGGIYQSMLGNYNTAIAVSTLAAANDPANKDAMDRAIGYLRKQQWNEEFVGPNDAKITGKSDVKYGGFGYGRKTRPDLSNSHFAIEALHDAGLKPGDKAYDDALVFLSRCQNFSETNDQSYAANDGGFIYATVDGGDSEAGEYKDASGKKINRSYGSMTYAGLKSMIYAGLKKDDPRVKAAVGWIQKNWTLTENPGMGAADPKNAQHGLYYYYQVMGKALNTYDEPTITDASGKSHDWRIELIDQITKLQKQDGSWSGEKRWMEDNPIIVTSYCVQALQATLADLKEHPAK